MKKTMKRPLVLTRDTIRILERGDQGLAKIVGGYQRESTAMAYSCGGSCECQ